MSGVGELAPVYCLSLPFKFPIASFFMFFVQASVRSCGKLVDDLDPAQFDLMVQVLSHLTLEKDYKLLLLLKDIREVVDNLEEFVT